MKKFEYKIFVPAPSEREADQIMEAIVKIIPRLSAEEWKKIAEVVSNPVQLAMIKSKLGI